MIQFLGCAWLQRPPKLTASTPVPPNDPCPPGHRAGASGERSRCIPLPQSYPLGRLPRVLTPGFLVCPGSYCSRPAMDLTASTTSPFCPRLVALIASEHLDQRAIQHR